MDVFVVVDNDSFLSAFFLEKALVGQFYMTSTFLQFLSWLFLSALNDIDTALITPSLVNLWTVKKPAHNKYVKDSLSTELNHSTVILWGTELLLDICNPDRINAVHCFYGALAGHWNRSVRHQFIRYDLLTKFVSLPPNCWKVIKSTKLYDNL